MLMRSYPPAAHVGGVLGDVVPQAELAAAAREDLPREYRQLSERVLPGLHRDGSLEKV